MQHGQIEHKSQYIMLPNGSCVFPLSWHTWSSIPSWSQQKRENRQTEEPMTITKKQTNKKHALHNISTKCSVTCIQLISAPKPKTTHLQLLKPKHSECTATADGALGIKVKTESLISTRRGEKLKIQNSVDCAFDYFRLI